MQNYFPILNWLGNYKKEDLKGDFFAGVTVGIMLIPQGMAYALIAGLPPVYGLYASIVPQIIYAIFGTSRQLSVAPVAMDSLLVAAGVSVLAVEGTETYIAFAILLAFFMGLFQLLMGVLKMGFLTNLLSKPVISGFTSAAALIIGLNQLKHLLGVELVKSNKIHEIVYSAIQNIDETHWITLLIGIAGIVIIQLAKGVHQHLPGALIAVIFGTSLAYYLSLDTLGVLIVKDIPVGLPSPVFPDFSLGKLGELIPLAFTISLVAFMEAFSIAKSIELKKKNYKVIPNQELIALGAANLVGSVFQAFPVTGGFSRSAVNYQAGANTPLASLFSAALVALTLIFLTPLFYFLPNVILAAVIIVAIIGLIDIKQVKTLWLADKRDLMMLLVTFSVTLFAGITLGIATGVLLSLAMIIFKSSYPHVAVLGKLPKSDVFRNIKRFVEAKEYKGILVLRFDAQLFFANSNFFRTFLEEEIAKREDIKLVIVNAQAINALDSTAIQMLAEVNDDLQKSNIKLVFALVTGPVRDTLVRSKLLEKIGENHIFETIQEAVRCFDGEKFCKKRDIDFQTNLPGK